MPPSPSPYPSTGFNSSSGRTDNFEGDHDERCEVSSYKRCHDLKNMTACLSYTGSGNGSLTLLCYFCVLLPVWTASGS